MTIFFPDISGYQTGIRLDGIPAVMVKATEGTGYVNPDYGRVVHDAAARGLLQMSYHFLHRGSAGPQADFALSVIGSGVPTMVDVEPAGDGTAPTMGDVFGFVDEFRARGGLVHLVYLPRWYWSDIGQPDLTSLERSGLHLVSSLYTQYGDSGPGWAPYGGVSPAIWQFSETNQLNGYTVDMNAYRGSVDDLRALVTGEDVLALDSDPNWQALIWRMEGLIEGRDAVIGGPTAGEKIWPTAQLKLLEQEIEQIKAAMGSSTGPITDAQVAAIGNKVADAVVAHHDALTAADTPVIKDAAETAVRDVLGGLATPKQG